MNEKPSASTGPVPHPLAIELARVLSPGACVLELGSGRGRNTAALLAAGMRVEAIADQSVMSFDTVKARFDAALSTHGFLHGTPDEIAGLVTRVAASLRPAAPLYATFGSISDARFGSGARLGPNTFVPQSGDERGVAHTYFDRAQLRNLLELSFRITSLEERCVDEVAGRWAHAQLLASAHWFVRAVRR